MPAVFSCGPGVPRTKRGNRYHHGGHRGRHPEADGPRGQEAWTNQMDAALGLQPFELRLGLEAAGL